MVNSQPKGDATVEWRAFYSSANLSSDYPKILFLAANGDLRGRVVSWHHAFECVTAGVVLPREFLPLRMVMLHSHYLEGRRRRFRLLGVARKQADQYGIQALPLPRPDGAARKMWQSL